jgi:antitoxin HicB
MGADALMTAMEFYVEDGRPLPKPSVAARGQALIELLSSVGPQDSGSKACSITA